MEEESNDLSGDPSQLSFKQKIKVFEENSKDTEAPKPKRLSSLNIFPKKDETSNSDNLATPSPQQTSNNSSTNGYPKKQSTSTDNRATTPSSNEFAKSSTPNSSSNSSGNIRPLQHSTAKKPSKVHFEANEINVPEIVEVFTDLDLFIDKELDEISCRKRLGTEIPDNEEFFTKLKQEYLKDKQQHQCEFERQMNQGNDKKLSMINEDEEISSLDVSIASKMSRLRMRKIEWLRREAKKQEYLLAKINRVLERAIVEDRNIKDIVVIERHYLVAGMRLQAALGEYKRLTESAEPLHPRPFHHKGSCTVSELMVEVKQRYFDRSNSAPNEFIVVVLKNEEQVYASRPLQIMDDIRTLKFPATFQIPEIYADFSMRLEVHGTTLWRKEHKIRRTMLKKYGFVNNITLVDTADSRMRFDMYEVIKTDHNPLRKKILMKIQQTITPDVHFQAALLVKLGEFWYKAFGRLCGHLLEIDLIPEAGENNHELMLLDLHNFDSNFVIPIVQNVSKKPFTFLMKFNHYVDENEFYLLVAAESNEDYNGWINSINKTLVLLKH